MITVILIKSTAKTKYYTSEYQTKYNQISSIHFGDCFTI